MTSERPRGWGDPTRYYSHPNPDRLGVEDLFGGEESVSARVGDQWAAFFRESGQETEQLVWDAIQRWNTPIRDTLRNEMALGLRFKGEARSVPVQVMPGVPVSLAQILDQEDSIQWLMANRHSLEAAVSGAGFLLQNQHRVSRFLSEIPDNSRTSSWKSTLNDAKNLLEKANPSGVSKKIGEIEEDVLGAYFFLAPKIHIYWMAVGIVSTLLGVHVSDLAAVVLSHELAHAYSHLGFDIDGKQWDTDVFAHSDLKIVEGIAQHYTAVTCVRLGKKSEGPLDAYHALLEIQTGPYRAHEKWRGEDELAGEFIRMTMLQARRRAITGSLLFEEHLNKNREALMPSSQVQLTL